MNKQEYIEEIRDTLTLCAVNGMHLGEVNKAFVKIKTEKIFLLFLDMAEGLKRCSSCRKLKLIDEFGSNIARKDKLQHACKVCTANRSKNYNSKHKEEKSIYKAKQYRFRKNNDIDKLRKIQKRKSELEMLSPKQHSKRLVYKKVFYYVKKGDILKTPCITCGDVNSHAHHYNGYEGDNWKKVVWLCRKHHLEIHGRKDRSYLDDQFKEKIEELRGGENNE